MTGSLLASPTNWRNGVRIGAQVPRVLVVPEYTKTYGPEVVDFMDQIGRPLDPWQAGIIDVSFAVMPRSETERQVDLWAAFEQLILLARQNGKGGATEAIELGSMFLFREPLILHSAHQFKTSTAAFRRIIDIIDASDWLRSRVKAVSRSKGDEGIELTRAAGGSRLQFIARTLGSGRGLTGSKNIFDEAAWLTIGQYAAQTPALATIPNPQIIYTTTPPDEDVGPMPEDAMMPSVRKRAHAGIGRIACHEWSPAPGDDPGSEETMYATNPAAGIRIPIGFLKQQYENFVAAGKPEKFVTEHEGAWPPSADEQWQVIGEADWTDAGDSASLISGGRALGISMPADQSRTAIGTFGRREDGLRHCQLVEYGSGSGWVVPWVQAAMEDEDRPICAVVIGANDPARSLKADLEAAGIAVITPGTADMAAECGAIYLAIAGKDTDARDLRHKAQGPVTAAIAGAAKKRIGAVWLWDRLALGTDVSPLYAITAASYGFRVCPPDDYDVLDSVM